ncbi:ATP-grasp domain-containing protein [Streptomyces caatingaensis]|uniref:ATP-grasp domain-containing protein n=1 Tax=Streptomyces caatingaensis TaxID=1678637 RepID=UPI00067280C0|nr:ATP-grasp domain-containing protein [Streptomyces caatingaensis]
MSRRRSIVLLGPHPALCERARRAGLGVIVVDTPGRLLPGVIAGADHVIATDYTDTRRTAALLSVLGEDTEIVGVLSLTEPGLVPVARINALLGLPDNPVDVVERVKDKDLMRRWLADDPRFSLPAALVRGADDLAVFLADHGAPAVVKPHDGAGSVGVRLVRGKDEAGELAYPLLAEKYVEGREFSVESLSADGVHTILGITEKSLFEGGFVERGHTFPAPLTGDDEALLRGFVRDFLTRVGLRHGLAHTEVILTADGPVAVETHTRNGGDHITDLVQLATGYDMLSAAVRAKADGAEGPAGQEVPAAARTAVIRYLAAPAGTVREIHGTHAARYLPGVVDLQVTVGKGDVIRPVSSSLDRVGYVIAVGADADEAVRHARAALDTVELTVE